MYGKTIPLDGQIIPHHLYFNARNAQEGFTYQLVGTSAKAYSLNGVVYELTEHIRHHHVGAADLCVATYEELVASIGPNGKPLSSTKTMMVPTVEISIDKALPLEVEQDMTIKRAVRRNKLVPIEERPDLRVIDGTA